MSLEGTSIDTLAIAHLERGGVKQVIALVAQLQPCHNIDAVHELVNRYLNPALWQAFLSNAVIQDTFCEAKLKDMFFTTLMKIVMPGSLEWQQVHDTLMRLKAKSMAKAKTVEEQYAKAKEWEDIQGQVTILEKLGKAEPDSPIFADLLTSPHSLLWHAFIQNRMVTSRLLKSQYEQLVISLQNTVLHATNETSRKEWLILLAIYALKLYPANYPEKICPSEQEADKTARFTIILEYAIAQIRAHGQLDTKDAHIETVKWLLFALKLAEHPPTLALLQAHPLFQQTLPFKFGILSPAFAIQFLNLFPHFFTQMLRHIYSCKAEYGQHKHHPKYRELVALVKMLKGHPQFAVVVNADAQCCELLGITAALAPQPAQSSAYSSAMQTDDDDEAFDRAPLILLVDDEPITVTPQSEATLPMLDADIFKNNDDDSLDEVPLTESTPLLARKTAAAQDTPGFWQRLFTPCFSSCFNRAPNAPRQEKQRQCPDLFGAIVRFGQTRP